MEHGAGHHICGIDELAGAPVAAARRIVSILEPAAPIPPELAGRDADLLALRFDDVIEPRGEYLPPAPADIERLLAFDAQHEPGDRLLIHCRAGISRSTAAFVILLAQRRPGAEADIFEELRAIRPLAWPNSLMIALGDDLLGASGRLTRELREHYKGQLHKYPAIGRMMIGLGRESEIPFDRLTPDAPDRSHETPAR